MRHHSRVLAASFGLLPLVSAAREARAQPEAPPSLGYDAPTTCPAQDVFVERVRSRLARSRARLGAERAIAVQITAGAGRYQGTLSFQADGRTTTKTLSDTDCDALVDALALVAALAA